MNAATRTTSAGSLAEVTRLAYGEGLAAGLRAVLDPTRPVPGTRCGYTLVPARHPVDGTVLPHPLAAREGLAFVRLHEPTCFEPEYGPPLAAVRLGLLHRMLDAAVAHLGSRRCDGSPLIGRQLVQASVADLATTLETGRHALSVGGDDKGGDDKGGDGTARWLHARLDRADQTVATLFGAAGYLRDHPVRCLHVAALVREAWLPW